MNERNEKLSLDNKISSRDTQGDVIASESRGYDWSVWVFGPVSETVQESGHSATAKEAHAAADGVLRKIAKEIEETRGER